MLVFLLAALENDEDKKLFTEIYEQYRPQMERTAMHFLKSHADVEDAVQNAFMQMIRHFEKIYDYQKKPKDRPIGRLGWPCKGIGKYVRLY